MPFSVHDNVDHPISLYAATKKANELMAHAYSKLYGLPATGLRFFTVYGPWYRPDMAMFIFTKAILEGRPIRLFNHGRMRRDFTYVDDVVAAMERLLGRPPGGDPNWSGDAPDPSSSSAPWRLYNIGNNRSIEVTDVVDLLEREPVDLLISDIKMPDLSGVDVLRAAKKIDQDILGIMITAFASTDSAVEAMRLGACDYLSKPFDIDLLKMKVREKIENRHLRQENVLLKRTLGLSHQFSNIIGRSESMLDVFKMIETVARTNSTILLTGESGTGKGLVAQAIHFHSLRRDRPVVAVVRAAAGERDLPGVRAEGVRAAQQQDVRTVAALPEQNEHRSLPEVSVFGRAEPGERLRVQVAADLDERAQPFGHRIDVDERSGLTHRAPPTAVRTWSMFSKTRGVEMNFT